MLSYINHTSPTLAPLMGHPPILKIIGNGLATMCSYPVRARVRTRGRVIALSVEIFTPCAYARKG